MKKGLTYDDVLLVPQYSDIESRSEVSLTTEFGRGVELGLPIIASPMDTVSEADMAGTLGELGGISIIHRYNSIEEQSAMIASLGENTLVGAAVGVSGDYEKRAISAVAAGAKVICIDIAHGHHILMKKAIKKIRKARTELGIHPKNKFKVEILINSKVLFQDMLDNITLVNNLSGIDMSIIKEEERESNDFIQLIDNKFTLYLYIKNMINIKDEINKIEKNIFQLESVLKKIDCKLNNKSFIEKAPSEIINQNVSNREKISNEILSLENLKSNLSN